MSPGGAVRVRVLRGAVRVRVEVTDDGGGDGVPVVPEAGWEDESGRGVMLVAAMSAAWGDHPEGAGRTVWFEVAEE